MLMTSAFEATIRPSLITDRVICNSGSQKVIKLWCAVVTPACMTHTYENDLLLPFFRNEMIVRRSEIAPVVGHNIRSQACHRSRRFRKTLFFRKTRRRYAFSTFSFLEFSFLRAAVIKRGKTQRHIALVVLYLTRGFRNTSMWLEAKIKVVIELFSVQAYYY